MKIGNYSPVGSRINAILFVAIIVLMYGIGAFLMMYIGG